MIKKNLLVLIFLASLTVLFCMCVQKAINNKIKKDIECHVGDKYAQLRRAMGLKENADISEWIEQYNASIGLPENLAVMGVTDDLIPALAQQSTGRAPVLLRQAARFH